MFEFLCAEPYEERKVARFEASWGFISTASVNDGSRPYETAVEHPAYNDGGIVVVQAYETKEDALLGHAHWVFVMTAPTLPPLLKDCGNSFVQQMANDFGIASTYLKED